MTARDMKLRSWAVIDRRYSLELKSHPNLDLARGICIDRLSEKRWCHHATDCPRV